MSRLVTSYTVVSQSKQARMSRRIRWLAASVLCAMGMGVLHQASAQQIDCPVVGTTVFADGAFNLLAELAGSGKSFAEWAAGREG